MLTIRAMSDGKGYSSRHLEHADYYAEGERVVGHWQGRGAELLGLDGPVKSRTSKHYAKGSIRPTVTSCASARALTASPPTERRNPTEGAFTTSPFLHRSRCPSWPWSAATSGSSMRT